MTSLDPNTYPDNAQDPEDIEDLEEEIIQAEDVGEVIDDELGDQPMSGDELDGQPDDMDATEEQGQEGENSLPFEDDSIQAFFEHREPVYAIAMSPIDPHLVASGGGDDWCYLWRCDNGEKVYELTKHDDSVVALGFSKDGQYIASGGMDGKVHVSLVSSGKLVTSLEGPTEVVWLKWHPRGNVLLAGGEDGTVWMWNIPSGNCMAVFTGHLDQVTCGDFTPDGKHVVTTSADGSMILWNPQTAGSLLKMSSEDGRYHQGPITSLAIHKDNQLVLTGAEDGTLRLVHLSQGKILASFVNHAESIEGLAFSDHPNYPFAVSGSVDGGINIWDLTTFQQRHAVQHENAVTRLVWQSQSPYFYSSSMDCTVKKWDARTGECVSTWKGHQDGVLDFSLSSDLKRIVTASDDGVCLVFSAE